MRKTIHFILLITLILTLVGCNVTGNEDSSALVPQEHLNNSYDSESRIEVDSKTEGSDFLIKLKKYDYYDGNVMVLDVTNETENNYTVTITGNYLDKDGDILQNETQTFEGFAAGYQKYFIFMPKIKFDSFTYTIETKNFNGECLANNLNIENKPLRKIKAILDEAPYHTMYPILITDVDFENKNKCDVHFVATTLIFDNKGNLFHINTLGMQSAGPGGLDGSSVFLYYEVTEEDMVTPDNLTGNITIICTVDAIFSDYQESDTWLVQKGMALQKYRNSYGIPHK